MTGSVSGFVLAGGESSRMAGAGLPPDKALLLLKGSSALALAEEKVQAVCGNATILGGTPERCARLGSRAIPDRVTGCGPLGGLQAALQNTEADWLLIVPVDLPLLPAEALRQLLAAATVEGSPVTVFEAEGFVQPLPVVVHRSVRPFVDAAIEAGDYKLLPVLRRAAKLLASAGLQTLPTTTEAAGETARWFLNMNTPADYESICATLDASARA